MVHKINQITYQRDLQIVDASDPIHDKSGFPTPSLSKTKTYRLYHSKAWKSRHISHKLDSLTRTIREGKRQSQQDWSQLSDQKISHVDRWI